MKNHTGNSLRRRNTGIKHKENNPGGKDQIDCDSPVMEISAPEINWGLAINKFGPGINNCGTSEMKICCGVFAGHVLIFILRTTDRYKSPAKVLGGILSCHGNTADIYGDSPEGRSDFPVNYRNFSNKFSGLPNIQRVISGYSGGLSDIVRSISAYIRGLSYLYGHFPESCRVTTECKQVFPEDFRILPESHRRSPVIKKHSSMYYRRSPVITRKIPDVYGGTSHTMGLCIFNPETSFLKSTFAVLSRNFNKKLKL